MHATRELYRWPFPIFLADGNGAYVRDVDGNGFIDWYLCFGLIVLGHCDHAVDEAAIAEIRNGFSVGLTRPIQNRLAQLLIDVVPCAEKVYFCVTGSDATTSAVRLARVYTGRDKIIRWGYHGWHDWCSPKDKGIPQSTLNDTLTFEYNNLESLERVFKEHKDQVAGVIMMPLEIELPKPGFLEGVKEVAHRHGALFILDEMRSGFHMALGGAQEYYGVTPDLATFSKAMSNGYAISAIVGRHEVMDAMNQTFVTSAYHTHSMAAAAAVAAIERMKQGDVIPHLWRIGQGLQDGLNQLVSDTGVEAKAIAVPPMPFLDFFYSNEDRCTKAMHIFYSAATRGGVLLHPRHHWYSCFAHTDADLDKTLTVCADALAEVRKGV